MRCLLAGVLVVAAGVGRGESPSANPVRLGMSQEEVDKILGKPIHQSGAVVGVYLGSTSVYQRVDWLGGQLTVRIDFDADNRVTGSGMQYRLFAEQPAWLERVVSCFGSPSPP